MDSAGFWWEVRSHEIPVPCFAAHSGARILERLVLQSLVRQALSRSGQWLCRNDERHGVLSNHLAAAAAALEHVYLLTGDAVFRRRSRHFIDRILSRQSREGWYDEYGGADPGYQTHGTCYLARIWQLTGDSGLLDSMRASTRFLAHCVHPDGSLGGD